MAEFPNECWQADVTHVEVADGDVYEVLNMIDDHSRLCVASQSVRHRHRAPDVVRTLHQGAATWGYPQARLDRQRADLHDAARLRSRCHGGRAVESGHRHETWQALPPPETQGKVERFHQTLKKYLAKQDPATTKKLLVGQLRPIRRLLTTPSDLIAASDAVGRSTLGTPARRWGPSVRALQAAGYRIRHDKVDRGGSVTLRYKAKLHHIGVGCPYAGWRVILLVAGLDVQVLGIDGSPLRHLTLDPSVD